MAAAIASWAELEAFLAASGRDVRPHEKNRVSFALAPGSPRRVHARAVHFPSGSTWLALSVYVCPPARLRLRAALVANAELPIGGIAVSKDEVVLRQTLPLSRLGIAELEQALGALAATVDALDAALAAAGAAESEQRFAYAFR